MIPPSEAFQERRVDVGEQYILFYLEVYKIHIDSMICLYQAYRLQQSEVNRLYGYRLSSQNYNSTEHLASPTPHFLSYTVFSSSKRQSQARLCRDFYLKFPFRDRESFT